jgi:glutamine amidotransferase
MNPAVPPGGPLVTVIDLEIQNILSVENAFRVIGAQVRVVKDASGLDGSGFLVLPGVGAFGAAMARLHSTGLYEAVRHHALQRKLPVMGLCLGMQLLSDGSDEYGHHPGLGLVPGSVRLLKEAPPEFRVPNIGWREVCSTGNSALLGAAPHSYYHVHSYHMECANASDVAAVSRFGDQDITSIVHRGNVFGTQFHPEKSQDAGLDLLHAVLHGLN